MSAAIKITIDGIIYGSLRELSVKTGISYSAIKQCHSRHGKKGVEELVRKNNISNKETEIKEEPIIKEPVKVEVSKSNTNINTLELENFQGGICGLENAINKARNYKGPCINLIDYENVLGVPSLDNIFEDTTHFNIFFFNAIYNSNKFFSLLSRKINNKILPVMINKTHHEQFVDKLILTCAALLSNQDVKINIISNDRGYEAIINCLPNENIHIVRLDPFTTEDKKILHFCKRILTNQRSLVLTKLSREKLKDIINKYHFGNQAHDKTIKAFIELLMEYNIVNIKDRYYNIDINMVSKINCELENKKNQ